jgi:hypothetical protein
MNTPKKLSFAAIVAAISITPALAEVTVADNRTPTSKGYVDNVVGTRQAKIPIAGTNSSTAGETVVMYTDTAGTIGERGIYNGGTYTAGTDANKLVTAAALDSSVNNIDTMATTKLTCANSPTCNLWTIDSQTVYGSGDNNTNSSNP